MQTTVLEQLTLVQYKFKVQYFYINLQSAKLRELSSLLIGIFCQIISFIKLTTHIMKHNKRNTNFKFKTFKQGGFNLIVDKTQNDRQK